MPAYTLTGRATDTQGNSVTAPVTITVQTAGGFTVSLRNLVASALPGAVLDFDVLALRPDGSFAGGESVTITVVSGGGTASSASPVLWGRGTTDLRWTLGTAGEQRVRVTIGGVSSVDGVVALTVPPPPPPPPPPGSGANLVPDVLRNFVSPVIAKGTADTTSPISDLMWRYDNHEPGHYQNFLAAKNAGNSDMAMFHTHTGPLIHRIQAALRHGEAYGPGATSAQTRYGRGREMVLYWLAWAKSIGWMLPGHGSTLMADVGVLAILEALPDAISQTHACAAWSTENRWGDFDGTQAGEPRLWAIALDCFSAAMQLGIPYTEGPAAGRVFFWWAGGSWQNAGKRQVDWIAARLRTDSFGQPGFLESKNHHSPGAPPEGVASPWMNAWFAFNCLKWFRRTGYAPALTLARNICDWLILELAREGGDTLWYLTYPAAEQVVSHDLAGYFVGLGMLLWRETGDAKYRTFALKNASALTKSTSWLGGKHYNQAFSYGTLSLPALESGVAWR